MAGDIYRHPDVLDYSANINPLGTPPGVIRAAKDSMERVCHYPDACQEKLKQALAEYEQVPVEWTDLWKRGGRTDLCTGAGGKTEKSAGTGTYLCRICPGAGKLWDVR